MKKTHIFFGNQHIDSMYCGKTKWDVLKWKIKRFTKRVMFVSAAISILGWTAYGSYEYAKSAIMPVTVFAEKTVEVPVTVTTIPPVMQRIAKCESGGTHYRNGQVVINATQDIGMYQINVPVWGKKAAEMGLDLSKEKDNETFAMYLYQNYGSEPWYSSKHCWNK